MQDVRRDDGPIGVGDSIAFTLPCAATEYFCGAPSVEYLRAARTISARFELKDGRLELVLGSERFDATAEVAEPHSTLAMQPLPPAPDAPETHLAATQARLGFQLLEVMQAESKSEANLVVSPASAAAVLAALHVGADAGMRAALLQTLGMNDEAAVESLRRSAAILADQPDDTPLKFANALFVDPATSILPAARAPLRRR